MLASNETRKRRLQKDVEFCEDLLLKYHMKKRSVEQAFSEVAPEYDAWVKQALPAYDELFSVAVDSIPFAHDRPLEIADLGAGSGLFGRHVLSAYPQAAFTLAERSRLCSRLHLQALFCRCFSGGKKRFVKWER